MAFFSAAAAVAFFLSEAPALPFLGAIVEVVEASVVGFCPGTEGFLEKSQAGGADMGERVARGDN